MLQVPRTQSREGAGGAAGVSACPGTGFRPHLWPRSRMRIRPGFLGLLMGAGGKLLSQGCCESGLCWILTSVAMGSQPPGAGLQGCFLTLEQD